MDVFREYIESATYLLDAMSLMSDLVEINTQIIRSDIRISDFPDTGSSEFQKRLNDSINRKAELAAVKAGVIRRINGKIINSSKKILDILYYVSENGSKAFEISLCQKHLKSLLNFLSSNLIKDQIDLSPIHNELVFRRDRCLACASEPFSNIARSLDALIAFCRSESIPVPVV